jgi:hypothetical protein
MIQIDQILVHRCITWLKPSRGKQSISITNTTTSSNVLMKKKSSLHMNLSQLVIKKDPHAL